MTPPNRCFVRLQDEPIDPGALADKIADPDVGAHGWFYGVTRRTTDDKTTQLLSYEAHPTMALDQLEQIATAAVEKFGLTAVVIVHRLGEVPVGEASVVVGCSGGHRPEVFAALPWIMDTLKKDVPIWKRESYTDGSKHWVHPTGPS